MLQQVSAAQREAPLQAQALSLEQRIKLEAEAADRDLNRRREIAQKQCEEREAQLSAAAQAAARELENHREIARQQHEVREAQMNEAAVTSQSQYQQSSHEIANREQEVNQRLIFAQQQLESQQAQHNQQFESWNQHPAQMLREIEMLKAADRRSNVSQRAEVRLNTMGTTLQ